MMRLTVLRVEVVLSFARRLPTNMSLPAMEEAKITGMHALFGGQRATVTVNSVVRSRITAPSRPPAPPSKYTLSTGSGSKSRVHDIPAPIAESYLDNERSQRFLAHRDSPYTSTYFLDLVEQIRRYAESMSRNGAGAEFGGRKDELVHGRLYRKT